MKTPLASPTGWGAPMRRHAEFGASVAPPIVIESADDSASSAMLEAARPAERRLVTAGETRATLVGVGSTSRKRRDVRVGRVYDEPGGDGARVLVDRVWPRGLAKSQANIDEWCKDVAPSTELRKWYSHDPTRFEEFSRRYHAELQDPARAAAFAHLRDLAAKGGLVLLTATKQVEISQAAVLADALRHDH